MPIKERDEPRSADPVRDNGIKVKNPSNYQYRMRNEPKGYRDEQENKLPQINEKSYLQNRGAAILGAGNKYRVENNA
jgi:beta-N-acetylglucosaminidase